MNAVRHCCRLLKLFGVTANPRAPPNTVIVQESSAVSTWGFVYCWVCVDDNTCTSLARAVSREMIAVWVV